jgi:sugar phosphate permease
MNEPGYYVRQRFNKTLAEKICARRSFRASSSFGNVGTAFSIQYGGGDFVRGVLGIDRLTVEIFLYVIYF